MQPIKQFFRISLSLYMMQSAHEAGNSTAGFRKLSGKLIRHYFKKYNYPIDI